MLGKAFKKAVTKPVTGGLEAELFDETGVDIAEALDIVNNYVQDDASKDFSEKEIAVIEDIMSEYDKSKIKNFEFSIEKICSPGQKLNNCPLIMGKKEEDDFFKRNLLQLLQIDVNKTDVKRLINQRSQVPEIKENLKDAIRRGRQRAKGEKSIQSRLNFLLPAKVIQSPKRLQSINQKEMQQELSCQPAKSQSSFTANLSQDNNCEQSLVFTAKCFFKVSWERVEFTIKTKSKVIEITAQNRETPLLKLCIMNIAFIKVEDNQLVVWIQRFSRPITEDAIDDKNDEHDNQDNLEPSLIGVQLCSIADCSSFLLVLDYLTQSTWPQRRSLLEGGRIAEPVPDKPVLYSVLVGWILAGSGVTLEFVGKYRYNLKSAQKEIRSLEAAYFYLKAGVLYIYEFETERLPFFSLPLLGSSLSVICSEQPSVRIGVEGLEAKRYLQLAIFTDTLEEALRMERAASKAEKWTAGDNDESVSVCQLGVCDDRLVCLRQEGDTQDNVGEKIEHLNDANNIIDIKDATSEDKEDLKPLQESGKYSAKTLILGSVNVVSSSLGLESNSSVPGQPPLSLAWSKSWRKVLHMAVDYDNCNIQMAWISSAEDHFDSSCSPRKNRSGSQCTILDSKPNDNFHDPDLGGMAIFPGIAEMSKFVQTIQKCANTVAVLPINSRHTQKLALF